MQSHLIIEAMERWGGGFVKALAQAARKADPENLARLESAFPEIWRKYEALAKSEAPTVILDDSAAGA